MSDDLSNPGRPDRDRININEDYKVRDWAKRFGVSEKQLREAVQRVGPMVKDVEQHLGR
jgi:AraC-like DNA-binding protein